jgi:hypothetical protein
VRLCVIIEKHVNPLSDKANEEKLKNTHKYRREASARISQKNGDLGWPQDIIPPASQRKKKALIFYATQNRRSCHPRIPGVFADGFTFFLPFHAQLF